MARDLFAATQPKDLFADASVAYTAIEQPKMVGATHEQAKPEGPSGFGMGAMDPVYGASQLLYESLPESVQKGGNALNNWLASKGLPLQEMGPGGATQQVQEREQEYQQARAEAGEEGFDGGRMSGNVVSGVVPGVAAAKYLSGASKLAAGSRIAPVGFAEKLLSGAKKAATVLAPGGAFGASMPVTEGEYWPEKGKQTGYGALAGAIVPGIAGGVARMTSPKTAPAVRQMIDEGVRVTPGQVLGGAAKRAEEAATSIPFVGDVIKGAQKRGIDDFNKAALNRVLAPIGGKADEIGYKGIEKAQKTVSKAYDDLLPKMKIDADDAFKLDIKDIRSMGQNMLPARAQQFEKIIEGQVLRKFEASGKMHPTTMKEVDSQIGKMASKFKGSLDADQQMLGDALGEVQTSLRAMVSRGNPGHAPQLGKINEAYANLLRVERAAASTGAKGGVFTPNQLEGATKALDKSLRKRKTAHGGALMQDLATAGDEAIAQKLPSSGTTERALLGIGGGAAAGGMISPVIPAAMATGAGLYTPPVQKLIQALLTARPAGAPKVSESIRRLAPYLSPGAATVSNSGSSQR